MTAQERALDSEKDRFAVNEAFFGGGLCASRASNFREGEAVKKIARCSIRASCVLFFRRTSFKSYLRIGLCMYRSGQRFLGSGGWRRRNNRCQRPPLIGCPKSLRNKSCWELSSGQRIWNLVLAVPCESPPA